MNKALFAKEIKSNLVVTVIICLVIALYAATTISMYDPSLGQSLDDMMASMPEVFAAFGMDTSTSTLMGFMLNYLYGFLLTIFPFVFILILVNKLMIRHLDRGTMAYLLATPLTRIRIVSTLIGVLVALLILLAIFTTITEVACAHIMFAEALDSKELLCANVGLFCLWLFFAGMCFLSASTFSNPTAGLWVGGGVGIFFFLMQMIANVGEDFDFLNKVNPLELFDSYGLVAGEASAFFQAVILFALGILCFIAALIIFNRRNLSV